MGEEVEQSTQHMRSRGTRKLSDVHETLEEEAEATVEEDKDPAKVSSRETPGPLPLSPGYHTLTQSLMRP